MAAIRVLTTRLNRVCRLLCPRHWESQVIKGSEGEVVTFSYQSPLPAEMNVDPAPLPFVNAGIQAHKMVDLSGDPQRESLWFLEVIDANVDIYQRVPSATN